MRTPRLPALLALLLAGSTLTCSDSAGSGSGPGGSDADGEPDRARDAAPLTDADDDPTPDTGADALDADTSDVGLAPSAFAGEDTTTRVGISVTFDGSESDDLDGRIVAWDWSFGNGATDSGETVFYTYPSDGEFVARLTVTDDDGLTDSDTRQVRVEEANLGPAAVIVGPRDVVEGEAASFDGRESTDDTRIVSYEWDVGVEGVSPVGGNQLTYTWTTRGGYDLTLTVIDDEDASDTALHPIRVLVRPVAVITAPTTADEGVAVSFDGTDSYDEDGTVEEYLWTFPDGSEQTTPVASYAFSTSGELEVELLVTDDDGLTGGASFKVDVAPAPNQCPTAVITPPVAAIAGRSVTFSGAASSDDVAVTSWTWSWGDASPDSTGVTANHTFADPGDYTVTLTVADGDGCTYVTEEPATHTARATFALTVSESPPLPDLNGHWDLSANAARGETKPVIAYTCFFDFIALDFDQVELVHDHPDLDGCQEPGFPCGTVQPGLMAGMFSSDEPPVTITRLYPGGGGGCDERYSLTIESMETPDRFIGQFEARFTGGACAAGACTTTLWQVIGDRVP